MVWTEEVAAKNFYTSVPTIDERMLKQILCSLYKKFKQLLLIGSA